MNSRARFLAACLLLLPGLCAAEKAAVPRKVIALYSKANIPGDFKDIVYTQVHMHAEMPLNHLGVEVVYQEASGNLPGPSALEGVRGIITWFEIPFNFKDPRPVCRWLSSAMQSGRKVVMLGDPGLYSRGAGGKAELAPECAQMFRTLGVELRGSRLTDALDVKIARADPRMLGFERRLDLLDFAKVPLVRLLPGASAYLSLSLADGPLRRSEPVALTPNGAVAFHPFALYANRELTPTRLQWLVDPFLFFDEAFRLKGLPRPDVTTVNGRRVYFTHADGDGFFNRSELDPKLWCGEVFQKEFVDRYPDSPISVSMVTGYLDLAGYDDPDSWKRVRELLLRPNVEPAAHGYSHPLVWSTGKTALNIPGYTVDARREIVGSVDDLNQKVLPAGRQTRLFFWTGDCLPSMADIAIADQAGYLQMNGEGGRFDARYPSYAYLFPLGRRLGSRRQVYAPADNEDSFTNHWTGPFYGYREVLDTFQRTGAPRRVKPVDVYIHLYAAEKYASVQTVQKIYDWARAQPFFPLWAGDYIRSVQGFFAMRVVRLGEGRFGFEGGAAVRTVRFDDEPRSPDLGASRGVLGFKRENGSLYVFLDESAQRELVLSKRSGAGPYLADANFEVTRWTRTPEGVRFLRRGWWKGEFALAGLAPGRRYRVSGGGTDSALTADAAGVLTVRFPDSEGAGAAREVSVEPAP